MRQLRVEGAGEHLALADQHRTVVDPHQYFDLRARVKELSEANCNLSLKPAMMFKTNMRIKVVVACMGNTRKEKLEEVSRRLARNWTTVWA